MTEMIHPNLAPQGESLAQYIVRVRELRGVSQAELARRANVHPSTVTRLEGGATSGTRTRKDVQRRLANALKIPVEYLDAAKKGETVGEYGPSKICPRCWTPGTTPDPRWQFADAKFCLTCGDLLKSHCSCGEPILVRGRFCPQCGKQY